MTVMIMTMMILKKKKREKKKKRRRRRRKRKNTKKKRTKKKIYVTDGCLGTLDTFRRYSHATHAHIASISCPSACYHHCLPLPDSLCCFIVFQLREREQDTCEEVLGKQKTQHKEWISADTIHKLETRRERKTVLNNSRTRAAKARAQEEYTAVDREVKRSIKKDKRGYTDYLARQAETAAGQGNLRDLYLVTKKLTGKFQQTDKPVMDKNGNPLTTTNEQLKRWAEHFRELLNRPTPDSPPDIPPAETELPISCDKPSKTEIKKTIMTLRSGKAAGPDEIPAEAIKADIETAVQMLYSLFSKIWEKEEVPAQWKEGIIIKLPKKETLGTAATIEGSCSCQRQARFSTGFYWRG